jgi:hypothetical protein
MKEILNPVASLTFHHLDQVTSFIAGSAGKAYIKTSGEFEIPFAKGAISYSCTDSSTAGGDLYTVAVNGNLKNKFKKLGQGLLIIELESGERLLLGEPELPVTIKITESLMQKSLQISHKSWHEPYFVAN